MICCYFQEVFQCFVVIFRRFSVDVFYFQEVF